MIARTLFRATLVGLALAGSACISDLSLPSDPKLICTHDVDCPNGMVCNVGHVCVPSSYKDQPAPDLQSPPVVTPSTGKAGTTFGIRITGTEPMRNGPTVTLHLDPAVVITGCRDEGDRLAYTCEYTATGQENGGLGGLVQFDVRMENDLRVTTDKAFAGAFALDFAAPDVQARVSPATAALGETVLVDLLLSEPVRSAPVLKSLAADNTPLNVTFSGTKVSETEYAFTHRVTAEDNLQGTIRFTTSVTDKAGNQATNVPVGSVVINSTPPRISNVVVDTSVDTGAIQTTAVGDIQMFTFSAQPGFNLVKVDFKSTTSFDTAPAMFNVAVGGRIVPVDRCTAFQERAADSLLPNYSCTFTVTPGLLTQDNFQPISQIEYEVEPITVFAVDAAGNRASAAGNPVVFDLRPPSIMSSRLTITPPSGSFLATATAMTVGSTALLDFTVSEPLRVDPPVASTDNVLIFQKGNPSGTAEHYSATLHQAGLDAVFNIQTVLTDVAGNQSATQTLQQLLVDTIAPAAPSVGPGVVYTRAPWGRLDTTPVTTEPSFTVTGAASSVEGAIPADPSHNILPRNVWVRVYDGPDPATATLIQQNEVAADHDGAFEAVSLTPVDRSTVYVGVEDEAGNLSPVVRVKTVNWIGSLSGTNSTALPENPTLVLQAPTLFPALDPEPFQAAEVAANQSSFVIPGRGVWRAAALGASSPSARTGAAAVFDVRRGVTVLVGGDDANGPQSDTWEWDGTSWTRRSVTSPTARSHAAAAYNARLGKVVLFGGWAGGELNDTWTYDGVQWRFWRAPGGANVPPPRRDGVLAYNAESGTVVLFGGRRGTTPLNDLWEFDGTSWKQLSMTTPPPPRSMHSFVYIPRRVDSNGQTTTQERFLLFGGLGQSGQDLPDVWDMVPSSGTAWSTSTLQQGPSAREQQAAWFDNTNKVVIVFGGSGNSGALSDLWTWDGSHWTQTTVTGGPGARFSAAATWDVAHQEALVFGGNTGGTTSGELWALSNGHWTNATPTTPPSALQGHALAWDEAHVQSVLFGGINGAGVTQGTTWLWNGRHWVQPSLTTQPPARAYASMAYDRQRSRVVLFGGVDGTGTALSDVWEWDGTAWSQADASGSAELPAARSRAAMAFYCARQGTSQNCDATTAVVLMVGGQDRFGNPLRETWAWNGAQSKWIRKNQPRDASSRQGLAFDSTRFTTVLFGGLAGSGSAVAPVGDTFEWDGNTWQRKGVLNGPSARSGHSLAFDAVRNRVVLFGGTDGAGNLLADDWSWDGTTWTQDLRPCATGLPQQGLCDSTGTWVATAPTARTLSPAVFDTLRGRLLIFGGTSVNGALGDTWELGLDPRAVPAVLVTFDFGSTGSSSATLSAWTPAATIGGSGTSPGGALYAWDTWTGSWTAVGANTASQSQPSSITAAASGVAAARLIGPDGLIHLAVRPASAQGNGLGGAVGVQNIQISLNYRLP